jgi:hypothetical protein
MFFHVHGIGKKLLRTVHLCSYTFFIAFWPRGSSRAEQYDFEAVFTKHMQGSRLLRPSQKLARLRCTGAGAWDTFRDSRTTRFAFDSDAGLAS